MIAKGDSRGNSTQAIEYVLDKKKNPKILFKNDIIGIQPSEIAKEMRFFQKLNPRTMRNILHFQISPSTKDVLSDQQLNNACRQFLKLMKLDTRQHIIVKHSDKDHNHAHILVNRIDETGNCYDDSFIRLRSKEVGHQIAIQMGLISAKQKEKEKRDRIKELRQEIKAKHQKVMKQKPLTFTDWQKLMHKEGIEVLPHRNKYGDDQSIIGYRLKYKGANMKASEVDRNLTISRMTAGKAINPIMKQPNVIQKVKIIKRSKGFKR